MRGRVLILVLSCSGDEAFPPGMEGDYFDPKTHFVKKKKKKNAQTQSIYFSLKANLKNHCFRQTPFSFSKKKKLNVKSQNFQILPN